MAEHHASGATAPGTPAPETPAPGRHRAPDDRPWWKRPAPAAALLALTLLVAGPTGVILLTGGGHAPAEPGPGEAASSGATTDPAVTVPGTAAPASPAASTPPASPTPTSPTTTAPTTSAAMSAFSPASLAREAVASFDAAAAGAVPGALVHAGRTGENVDNSLLRVRGAWGPDRLGNGMTREENNTRALRAGMVEAADPLPDLTTTVRLTVDGKARQLPIGSAADTFAAIAGAEGPACPACEPLRITRVTSSTTTLPTTEGELTVPAYLYSVEGTPATLVAPGLAPEALINPSPAWLGPVPAEQKRTMAPIGAVTVSGKGRTISATVDPQVASAIGRCVRLHAVPGKHAVAIYAAAARPTRTAPCADGRGKVSLRLAEPVGTRTLLDPYGKRAIGH